MKTILLLFCLALFTFSVNIYAQTVSGSPKVLIITAHPDDETAMAATVYKITHELHGTVDQCVITNGEGGYKYSTLSEAYYGLELTDEKVGRENLPRIRKQELMNADKIIGVRNLYFLDQKDAHYGLNEQEPLDTTWNVPWIKMRLTELMTKNQYDFVFCLLPDSTTHAHHKAACILALNTIATLPTSPKPIILGVSVSSKSDSVPHTFTLLRNHPKTLVVDNSPMFQLDRTTPLGYNNKLNYKIVVNWEIAEHKSQGTMQLAMNQGDYENFWFFAINDKTDIPKCAQLFERLKNVPYPSKTY